MLSRFGFATKHFRIHCLRQKSRYFLSGKITGLADTLLFVAPILDPIELYMRPKRLTRVKITLIYLGMNLKLQINE